MPKIRKSKSHQITGAGGSNIGIYLFILFLLIIFGFLLRITPLQSITNFIQHSIPSDRSIIPTPSPTPIQLHTGKGIYQVSQAKHNGPTIFQVVFDPLDVTKGQTVTITTSISSPTGVSFVEGSLKTDNAQQPLIFTKISTNGAITEWSTTTTVEDTVWYRYILTVNAKNTKGSSSQIIVAPRS